ncbi:MAG: BamA/TamA family outer membrane protein [bacterium]|nr:BamA/TamA family outer membrane protein [bacterium]
MRFSLRHVVITALFLMICLTAARAAEPVLRSVTVRDNRYFSERIIIGWSGLKTGQNYSPEVVSNAENSILQNLAAAGYYFCRIDSAVTVWNDDSSAVALTFHILEGNRLVIKELTIEGDTLIASSELMPLSQPGKPFFAPDLESDLEDVLSAGEETGHPFARLDLRQLRLKEDSLAVVARLTSGPAAFIQSVRIIGLHSTKPRVLIRETRLLPGEPYSPSRIEKARQHIKKLSFIESISPPALIPLGGNRYDLLLQATEGRSNSFDGVVGYQPAAAGQKGSVTGLLDLSFTNLFGTGRKAKIHWERSSQYRQALELYYEEPWVAGLPLNLWGRFAQEIQDSLYLQRNAAGGVSWPASDLLTFRGSLFSEEVLPDSIGRQLLGLYQARSLGATLEAEYDARDYPENPTHGIYYRSLVSAARKDYESSANQGTINVRRYETDTDVSYALFRRQILNTSLHGRFLLSDENPIPQPDLYRLGGARTLRGYREDQFIGNIVAWGSLEYRYWLDKESRVYTFYTLGYYQREIIGGGKESHWPWGYGVGFRQGTRLGIIGFDFALGQDDVLATAKVHFRLINRF